MKRDPFKLKARTLSADVKGRLASLETLAKDIDGKLAVRCSRNLFESEETTEIKFIIYIEVTVGSDVALDVRLEVEADRTRGEKESIIGEIASVEVDPAHRRKGLAKTALGCVEDLWGELGATEVRTVGIGDGRVVWARQVFGNEFENPKYMRNLYEKWCETTGTPPKRIGSKPHRYPPEFLTTVSSVEYVKRIHHADQ